MEETHAMKENLHFNTLSKKVQKTIIDFWNKENLKTVNKHAFPVLSGLYGTIYFWIKVEDFLTLLNY